MELCIVQVGKKIWKDQYDQMKATLYVAPEDFGESTKQLPPYDSVPWYDAKLWQFVKARKADYIIIIIFFIIFIANEIILIIKSLLLSGKVYRY